MECWLILLDPYWRNIRSIVELAPPTVLEYLVGQGLVGDERAKLNESAIIKRSSLMDEWWGKEGSYKLSLILKSPVMTRILFILTSISLDILRLSETSLNKCS